MHRESPNPRKVKFKAEEAGWYATPEGRRQTQREFERALRAGTLRREGGRKVAKTDLRLLAELVEQAKQRATRAISIGVPIADLDRARRIAEKTGVGYQSVLKKAIRDGLRKAG